MHTKVTRGFIPMNNANPIIPIAVSIVLFTNYHVSSISCQLKKSQVVKTAIDFITHFHFSHASKSKPNVITFLSLSFKIQQFSYIAPQCRTSNSVLKIYILRVPAWVKYPQTNRNFWCQILIISFTVLVKIIFYNFYRKFNNIAPAPITNA